MNIFTEIDWSACARSVKEGNKRRYVIDVNGVKYGNPLYTCVGQIAERRKRVMLSYDIIWVSLCSLGMRHEELLALIFLKPVSVAHPKHEARAINSSLDTNF